MKDRKFFITDVGKKIKPSPIEAMIIKVLKDLKIDYYREISFRDLNPTNTPNGYYRFDFYIPKIDTLLEYDGKNFHKTKKQVAHDNIKNYYCTKNQIKLIRLVAKDIPFFIQILRSLT